MYFNHQLGFAGLSWFTGAGQPNANTIHFGGTAVHELGHWILLNDLACAPGVTMCHESASEVDTWDQFSLAADDISAANVIY